MPAGAVGFRIRSGRAMVVLMTGTTRSPVIADCREVPLADSKVPGSVQPYHAALKEHRLTNMRAAERLVAVVERATNDVITSLIAGYRQQVSPLATGALVVGSLIDPMKVANQHMRAHALEGQLFRRVVADALTSEGLDVFPIIEREAYRSVAPSLRRTPDALKKAIALMGKTRSGPWRADEKLAALGAWAALAKQGV
jgi:hypothetical protein